MIDYVRVRDKDTQHEYSVVASAVNKQFQDVLDDEPGAALDGTPLPPKYHVTEPPAYDDLLVDALKDEITRRNEGRPDKDTHVVVEEPGNKPQLVAALVADDESIDGL